ncbi:MAG: hypothetical protein QOE48_1315, partial [Mycobacterium sp.]|nr:hypothetical protein [Mycobacterium sp.]
HARGNCTATDIAMAAATGSVRPLTAKGQTAWPTCVLDADLHDASRLKMADYKWLNGILSIRG